MPGGIILQRSGDKAFLAIGGDGPTSRCGDIYENRVTGEYAVVLRGSEDRGDGPGIAHLTARPGSGVVGEHFHPFMIETFTVLKGTLDAQNRGQRRWR